MNNKNKASSTEDKSQMNQKLEGLLGMSRGAGFLVVGFDAVLMAAGKPDVVPTKKRKGRKKTKADVVLLAKDLSKNTEKELRYFLSDVPIYNLPLDMKDISRAIGVSSPVGVLAVADKGFKKAFEKHLLKDKP